MFIFNLKINSRFFLKAILCIFLLIILSIVFLSVYRLFFVDANSVNDDLNLPAVYNLTPANYTNVLKAVHDDIDTYIGQKICFSGYVYRVTDFDKTQFVLARNMVISSDYQTLVVGFLCTYENISFYSDGTWVEITGEIKKGYYHGDIPIIQVEQIKEIEKPDDEYVYPPDETYVATSSIL